MNSEILTQREFERCFEDIGGLPIHYEGFKRAFASHAALLRERELVPVSKRPPVEDGLKGIGVSAFCAERAMGEAEIVDILRRPITSERTPANDMETALRDILEWTNYQDDDSAKVVEIRAIARQALGLDG